VSHPQKNTTIGDRLPGEGRNASAGPSAVGGDLGLVVALEPRQVLLVVPERGEGGRGIAITVVCGMESMDGMVETVSTRSEAGKFRNTGEMVSIMSGVGFESGRRGKNLAMMVKYGYMIAMGPWIRTPMGERNVTTAMGHDPSAMLSVQDPLIISCSSPDFCHGDRKSVVPSPKRLGDGHRRIWAEKRGNGVPYETMFKKSGSPRDLGVGRGRGSDKGGRHHDSGKQLFRGRQTNTKT